MEDIMNLAEENLLHTYNRFKIVFDHGQGVHLYDAAGKKYLDFASGIGVMALGYGNEEYKKALKDQIDKVTHVSNLYYTKPLADAAKKICKASGMDRVFFTNSGTEGIEGAIKAARKYAFEKDGCHDHEIIAMNHSFHGRSMGALAVTGNPHYQEAFLPLIGHIQFADFNNLDSVKSKVNDKTCAIILETVQGEGGIFPADPEFLKGVRKLCDEKDILLILDEVQCGMGRTGYMYAWQEYGVKPDIMITAKGLGCGVPVGAFLMTQKVADGSLKPGDHGTTYGGNPFVCAAVNAVLDIFEKEKILDHVKKTGVYLEKKLDELTCASDKVKERRGKGFMQGLVLTCPPSEVINAALDMGLVTISAGSDVLRLLPPLVITEADIDEMISILSKLLLK